ncbi:MAG: UDP-glucose--hexose-1-phosphate uridylyltransferase [Woeseiaceae bacterium]
MSSFDLHSQSHRRHNPLTGQWVLVSPQRMQRPWQGQTENPAILDLPRYDPGCYLCPGNERAGGEKNPDYDGTFVFGNDFSALSSDPTPDHGDDHELLRAKAESGICRVVCFSPRHDLTLPEMALADIRRVVDLWAAQHEELGAMDDIAHVQIFENKGAVMGCSNPHPHGQIWAQRNVPDEPARELAQLRRYFDKHGSTLLGDYCTVELDRGERVVCQNHHFVAVVPFWAVWPFEIMLLCKRRVTSLAEMNDTERSALADIVKRITTRYDNLFECSFPYSAGMHQAPTDGAAYEEWDWHMHFYPALLRSATVRKFMVGYEMLAEPQRDITPEASAARLRDLSEIHYKQCNT